MDRTQPPRIVDQPEPCFVRLRKPGDRAWYAARIYRCLGMLAGEINGTPADIYQIWHGGDQITKAEYDALLLTAAQQSPF